MGSGFWLLFKFALPIEAPGSPGALWRAAEASDPLRSEASERLYSEYSYIGLALVIAGTALEAVQPVCAACGSWRRPEQSEITKLVSPLTSKFEDPPLSALPGNGLGADDAGTRAGGEQGVSTARNVLLVGVLALALMSRMWQRQATWMRSTLRGWRISASLRPASWARRRRSTCDAAERITMLPLRKANHRNQRRQHGRRSMRSDIRASEPVAQCVVHDLPERPPDTAGFGFELGRHIVVQRQRGSHPLMLYLKHHDVKVRSSSRPH